MDVLNLRETYDVEILNHPVIKSKKKEKILAFWNMIQQSLMRGAEKTTDFVHLNENILFNKIKSKELVLSH